MDVGPVKPSDRPNADLIRTLDQMIDAATWAVERETAAVAGRSSLVRTLDDMGWRPRRSLWARYVDWNVAAFDWCARHARTICWPLAAVGYAGGIAVSVLDTDQPETGLVWVGLASALVALGMGPPARAWAEDDSLRELVTAGPWRQTEPPAPFTAALACPRCGVVAVHPFATAAQIPETRSNPANPLVWRACIEDTCECVWSQLQ